MGLLWIDRTDDDEGADDQKSRDTIVRYRARMSSVSDGKREIRLGAPSLAPYAPHPTESGLYVARFRAKRQKPGANIWDVEVEYSTELNLPLNPLLAPPAITLGTEVREVASLFDKDSKPYTTTAGELIEATNEEADLVFSVGRAIPIKWPAWILAYAGAVNADDVRLKGLSLPRGTLKCLSVKIGTEETTEAGIDWCQLDFELHFRASGWRLKTPNRGFMQLKPRTATVNATGGSALLLQKSDYVKILVKGENKTLEVPSEPQMLDKNGALIANPTKDNIVILEFKRNDELPFSALPLK